VSKLFKFVVVGALGGAAPSLLDANRHLHDVLEKKGYAIDYFEVPNGEHSPESWRVRSHSGLLPSRPVTPDEAASRA
jgi:enterochelin esterase-like enzyme